MRIAYDDVEGPLGKFTVSTIRTVAGGGDNESYSPFGISFFAVKPSDFENYMAWPFETMVFPIDSRRGLYHAPYATEEEARRGHALMVGTIKSGAEFGGGVTEDSRGTPTLTPEEWKARMEAR